MRTMTQRSYVLLLIALYTTAVRAQADISFHVPVDLAAESDRQHQLRMSGAHEAFLKAHPRWSMEFDARSGLTHQGFGDPIAVDGHTPEEKAKAFLAQVLNDFVLPVEDLLHRSTVEGKVTYVHFVQVHAGVEVFGSHAMVKFNALGHVIAFRSDVVLVDEFPAPVAPVADVSTAWQGLSGVTGHERLGARWVMVPTDDKRTVRQAEVVTVRTNGGEGPGRYQCLVDAVNGKLLYRTNAIVSCGPPLVSASVSLSGQVYPGSPLLAAQELPLPALHATIGSTAHTTDGNGIINTVETGPVSATFSLRGSWANVSTLNVTPSFTTTLNEGANAVSFNAASTIQQRSAYRYVNAMHQHVNAVLPGFTGMDFEMPVRVDLVAPNCNAFYDAGTINFYEQGNNCRSFATIDDVVFHEYAHGINATYYGAQGGTFSNGAMDEGYADVWALSLAGDLAVGEGYHIDFAGSALRRYDGEPKVYPVDLLGDRHNDGQIIAGAWMDLYQALGNDMPLLLQLFKEAYGGLQATAPNGNEGVAFRDVLLDVLQADDDDSDITNGTPNGEAIVDAFARHGITLISGVRVEHDPILAHDANSTITVVADVPVAFPSSAYADEVVLRYRTNGSVDWEEASMSPQQGDTYSASLPAQPAGTLVHYYIMVLDSHGQVGGVEPAGAHLTDPRLPHTILVGCTALGTADLDAQHDFGSWTMGLPGDNAVRGVWASGISVPSYSNSFDTGTMCQPATQHTVGGVNCWFTANASSSTAPVGEQDVDGGSTSLLSPVIDVSTAVDPAISYWRWYTNAPPTGTNPGEDYWQVFASGDGGGSWVPVETTRTSERAWRRHAFRVVDVLGATNSIRLKYVASDSLDLSLDGSGGSLVEAAVDDLELWGVDISSGIRCQMSNTPEQLWPLPADDVLHIRGEGDAGAVRYEVLDMTGRLMLSGRDVAAPVHHIPVADLATGTYVLVMHAGERLRQGRFSVFHTR
ncbi:MAG: hypothetical protein JNM62_11905 [Flavobacteriales bacterium]|nr:hypothetical protein [Flavobacteriales bacterium]